MGIWDERIGSLEKGDVEMASPRIEQALAKMAVAALAFAEAWDDFKAAQIEEKIELNHPTEKEENRESSDV